MMTISTLFVQTGIQYTTVNCNSNNKKPSCR